MEKSDVIIYLADVKNADANALYEKFKLKLEPRRITRIENCMNDKEKKLIICTGVLLQGVLARFGVSSDAIGYGPHDKPYIKERGDVFFNISHSGNFVMIAVSGQPIGIDIQKPIPYKEALINSLCAMEERDLLGQDLVKQLNRVWAVKESYTKLTGEGSSKSLLDITYEAINDALIIKDNGKDVAVGSVVYADDLYQAVVETREPFHVSALNKMSL